MYIYIYIYIVIRNIYFLLFRSNVTTKGRREDYRPCLCKFPKILPKEDVLRCTGNLKHGMQSCLRSKQFFSWSRNFTPFWNPGIFVIRAQSDNIWANKWRNTM